MLLNSVFFQGLPSVLDTVKHAFFAIASTIKLQN